MDGVINGSANTSKADMSCRVAAAALQRGNLRDAEAALRMALKAQPNHSGALQLYADVSLRMGRLVKALDALITAIEGDFQSVETWHTLSQIVAALGDHESEKLEFLRERLKRSSLAEIRLAQLAFFLLKQLGLQRAESPSRVARIYRDLALPWMLWALESNRLNLALQLETLLYSQYVKQTETEEHFRNIVGEWVEPMRAAGKRLASGLPPSRRPEPREPWRVALILHNATILAHVQVMLGMLEGYSNLAEKPIEFFVVCLTGKSPPLESELARIGVELVYVDQRYPEVVNDIFQSILRLREFLGTVGAHAVVWISSVLHMPFSFALRLAPVQIWWAMKYHSMEFPEIDAYLTGASFARFVRIRGRQWRSARSQISVRKREGLEEQVARIRERLAGGAKIVLGTLAREEKIASPGFLQAVCALLKRYEDALFVWTGRTELPSIRDRFVEEGVVERTTYLGWVDTPLYAQVLDVFLDTFPAGCGLTVWEAMAAGKPVVFMACDGNQENISLDQLIWPLLNGEEGVDAEEIRRARATLGTGADCLYLRAHDADDYVLHASRLIENPELRKRAGEASRQFVSALLCDQAQTGRDYRDHFVEILEEHFVKRGGDGAH